MDADITVSRSVIEHLIREYIFSEKDRYILTRKLLDKITFEKIGEEIEMSDRQVKTRFKRANAIIQEHIKRGG